MALSTRSKFYFGHEVTPTAPYVDIDEGSGEITATLNPGYYSPQEFVAELQRALNEIGNLTYAVDFNRTTRRITISASGTFSILGFSGQHAQNDLYAVMGYPALADLTGASLYLLDNPSGYEYLPQFFLLDYVDSEMRQDVADASTSTTGSGKVEIVRFAIEKFFEFTIDFINDYCRNDESSLLETNLNGRADAIQFLQDIVKRGHIEFMPDRDDVNDYYTLILETTQASRQGTGYRLTEKAAFIGYYTTGLLTWRLIEE